LNEADIVLGILEKNEYQSQNIKIHKGSTLFIYTDGITEATNESMAEFGIERLVDILKNTYDNSVQQICSSILGELDKFREITEQNDDVTMITIKI